MTSIELPDSFTTTRLALQVVATHIVARRRATFAGRFGLRATPGGFGTPAFGDDETVRTSGQWLIYEHRVDTAMRTDVADLTSTTLTQLAMVVDVDLEADFLVGDDTPEMTDPDELLDIDPAAALALAGWFDLAWRALDATLGVAGPLAEPSSIQLWPEHFDLSVDVAVGEGRRANLGASAGDADHPEPYLYVGPWSGERPGDPVFWNAPFGAVVGHRDLHRRGDAAIAARDFFSAGIELLRDG